MRNYDEFDSIFKAAVHKYLSEELDWLQLKAQGIAESNLRPDAISYAGAIGIMQLMPRTAKDLGLEKEELYDPERNIFAGAKYMAWLFKYFKDLPHPEKWYFALAAYNAGIGNILRAIKKARAEGLNHKDWACVASVLKYITGPHYKETLNYVARIKRIYRHLKEVERV